MSYVGFETQQGSIYGLDKAGRTIRFKQSPGEGHDKIHAPHHCVYLDPKSANELHAHYNPYLENCPRIMIGARRGDKFISVSDAMQFKAGDIPLLWVIKRDTNETLFLAPVRITPVLGYSPLEKRYNEVAGESITHLGNPIIQVFDSPNQFKAAAPDTLVDAVAKSDAAVALEPLDTATKLALNLHTQPLLKNYHANGMDATAEMLQQHITPEKLAPFFQEYYLTDAQFRSLPSAEAQVTFLSAARWLGPQNILHMGGEKILASAVAEGKLTMDIIIQQNDRPDIWAETHRCSELAGKYKIGSKPDIIPGVKK